MELQDILSGILGQDVGRILFRLQILQIKVLFVIMLSDKMMPHINVFCPSSNLLISFSVYSLTLLILTRIRTSNPLSFCLSVMLLLLNSFILLFSFCLYFYCEFFSLLSYSQVSLSLPFGLSLNISLTFFLSSIFL